MQHSHITPGHVRAYQAVTTQIYGEVALWSCFIGNKPGVAIVLAEHVGEDKIGVMPLFVAITEDMDISFPGESGSSSGGGGPSRGFANAKTATNPTPKPK